MINVKDKTCLECKKIPVFNNKDEKKALYCFDHKKEGMINIIDKNFLECKKRPVFNNEGEKKGLYCSEHKKEGMINVKDKTCLECKKLPIYNIQGEKKKLYCFDHKKNGMINIKDKTCKTYLCSTQIKEKYDGYCLFCYINLFPDKQVSCNYKTKEYSVVDFVKKKFPDLSWITDKIINDGYSKRRPDLLLDLGYQVIIIEVDENQHIYYDFSCENKRLMQLSQDVNHRPIIFIRFNPDNYKKDGLNISSCWGINKKGICVIKKSKVNEWVERLNSLEEQIKYWINPLNITNKTVEIIQLYYDF